MHLDLHTPSLRPYNLPQFSASKFSFQSAATFLTTIFVLSFKSIILGDMFKLGIGVGARSCGFWFSFHLQNQARSSRYFSGLSRAWLMREGCRVLQIHLVLLGSDMWLKR